MLCTMASRTSAAFLKDLPLNERWDCPSLQTADQPPKQDTNGTQICHGRPNWTQWKRSSRNWPPVLWSHLRHSATWGLIKAKLNLKPGLHRKLVEEPKPITLQSRRESSQLKEISNTTGPALWAKTGKAAAKNIRGISNNPLLSCIDTLSVMQAVSKKVKLRKYFVHT